MPPSQPPWLQFSLQDSHLAFAIRTLDFREGKREAARIGHIPSPTSHTGLHLAHPSITSHLRDYYSCSVGQQSAHKRANRYIQLEPYNRSRVLVPNPDNEGHLTESAVNAADSRYLNANWLRESAGGKWWIGGQAPLPRTAHAFLTLAMCPVVPPTSPKSSSPSFFVRPVHTIVQLTQMVELGRRRADPYFTGPHREDMIITPEPGCDAPPIYVHVVNQESVESAQCIKTELKLRWGTTQREGVSEGRPVKEWKVTHLLYYGWPDFGIPEDNHSILNFTRLVERVNNRHMEHSSHDPNASPPILAHCSAGVGRTGSFISLCSLLRAHSLLSSPRAHPSSHLAVSLAPPLPASPLGPLPDYLNDDLVAREIDGLREQRTSMVQRKEQAIWVYQALRDAFDGM